MASKVLDVVFQEMGEAFVRLSLNLNIFSFKKVQARNVILEHRPEDSYKFSLLLNWVVTNIRHRGKPHFNLITE